MQKRIVISLGGSLVVPEDKPDVQYLKSFVELIKKSAQSGFSFYITVGGGKITREYQGILKDINPHIDPDHLDWVGIFATRLNARLVLALFGESAYSEVITNPTKAPTTDRAVIVGSGWKPGWSTDYVAVTAAETLGAKKVINLSNTSYVYDKDPNVYPDAEKFSDIEWKTYRGLVPQEWTPGLSTPFDPIASEKAQALGLEVAIIEGHNLNAIEKYFQNQGFEGTVIS